MAILRETFRKHKRIRFAVVQGNFQSEINRFAKGKRADIIAMMAHKRSMISRLVESSAVDGAVRKIHIPLLIIKDNAFELDSDLAGWIQIANSIA